MKRIIILLMIFGFVISGCTKDTSENKHKTISSLEAIEMMESEKDYIIVDVRTPEEFADGHIDGAINIPLDTISTSIPELPNKNQLIMIYCRSGNRSNQAANKLDDLGYTNVIDFGGINTWPNELVK